MKNRRSKIWLRSSHHATRITSLFGMTLLLLACTAEPPDTNSIVEASTTRAADDWPMYRGDLAGTGSSSLTEITPDNVAALTEAWSYALTARPNPDDPNAEPGSAFSQVTPVVVDGSMFLTTADAVVALDSSTGSELWRAGIDGGRPSRRGVAYWPGDSDHTPRVLATVGDRLLAFEAETGAPAAGFGTGSETVGEIDLGIPYNSVPIIYRNVLVVGANTPRGQPGGVGNARAFDVLSGAKLWEFNSVPQPDDPGRGDWGPETWGENGWQGRLGVNAWPFYFTLDQERGLVFLPLAAPVPFAYGGDRPGDNLFANSLVAVDIETGAYRWHFQTIHHDLWDHDPPAPPVLYSALINGEQVPALALSTKSGYLYLLNRESGEPIFGVEEVAVPPSNVPGEQASATQPIPVKPAPLARTRYSPADLVTAEDTSAEHAAACAERVAELGELGNSGPFTPWAFRSRDSAPTSTLLFPGLVGGHNWGGVAFDPQTSFLLAFSQDLGTVGWIEESGEDTEPPYALKTPRPASFDIELEDGTQRLPCQKPPWGVLAAIDASTGETVWRVPVGVSENLPDGKKNTGRPGRASAIVTASGVVFIASTDDNRFRALDIATGRELWVTELPNHGNANPMTYASSTGRQMVAVAATEQLVSYRLP